MATRSLTILGSSSGMPQANRAASGYILDVDGRLSLIDCGGGVCSSFLRHGFDPLAVERVFISHAHSDHVCELPLFIQMIYLAGRRQPLDIHVPSEFVEPLTAYLRAVYILVEKLPFALNIMAYEDGPVHSGTFALRAVANRHLQGYAGYIKQLGLPNRMQCYSFDITADEKSVFYSSDVSDFEDVKNHLNGKDYVVLETTHIDLEQFFEFAVSAGVGQFVMTHLGDDSEVAQIEQAAQKAGLKNIVIACDGMHLVL